MAPKQWEETWASWEHLIREDLERAEHRIQKMYGELALFGGYKAEREAFVKERLTTLIQEVCKSDIFCGRDSA